MRSKNIFKSLYFPFVFIIALLALSGGYVAAIFWNSFVTAIYTSNYGPQKTCFGIFFLFVFCTIIQGLTSGLFFALYAIPALIIGIFIFYKRNFSRMLVSATIVQTFVFAFHTIYAAREAGKTPSAFLFKDSFDEFIYLLSSSGQFEQADISQLETMLSFISKTLQGMLPCVYVLISLSFIYLIFALCRFVLEKNGMKIDFMPYFHELWIPKEVSLIFVFLFIISFFSESLLLTNAASIMFMVHVVCGISLIDLFLRGKGMPGFLRLIILFFLFLVSSAMGGFISSLLCCMGMSSRGRMESR